MNYIIDSNIDFYAELQKELNNTIINNQSTNNSESLDKICLLTHESLKDNYITLQCNHTFNYLPLYHEIVNQKTIFNHYETTRLYSNEIKCPYCRTVTHKLLPYIPDPQVSIKRGINFPSKNCLKLYECSWVIKSGQKKNCNCSESGYTNNNLTYCLKHHKMLDKKQALTELKDDIEWTDNHEKINKKYKVPELKKILKSNKLVMTGNKKQLIDRIINKNVEIEL